MNGTIKISASETRQFWEVPFLFEDEHLLALNKPGGLSTAPDPENPQPNLLALLHEAIAAGKPWARERGLSFLMNTHRMDAEASGVLIFAKTKPIQVAIADAFGSDRGAREYVILVEGSPLEERMTIEAKLAPHPTRPQFMKVDPRHGKRSRTEFEVLEAYRDYALLKCRPTPDRGHQVRIHARYAGYPVVGDESYRGRPLWLSRLKRHYVLKPDHVEKPLLAKPALHLASILLPHPISGEELRLEAPWPKELTVAVKYLRRYNGA